ncbi:MAG: EF-hand domain-containing protein [Ramlibacter sp.]|nr:EF-hand domain-containing protein [Ramlibacter sp.]
MHIKRRRIPNFETRSLALFATLSLGTVMALHAQTATPSNPATGSGTTTLPSAAPSSHGDKGGWPLAQINEAFRQLDANQDNTISRAEAQKAPGVARHFDRADTNQDGSLSASEFESAMKQAS